MFGITAAVLGGLGLFLYGMKIMSEGLQIATGDSLKNILWKATSNRFKGVLTGFGITATIQSSSATTVMLISFVSAGLINLTQATGIILGANIGTTVTGWIIALIGFKFQITALALPAIGIGFFTRFFSNDKIKNWGDVLLGFGMLFLGLSIMSDSVKDLRGSEVIMNFMSTYTASGAISTIVVVLVGAVITMIIQSSSATMAMTMTLAASGIIDFYTAAALILGENIGTTITANIAAMGASAEARRTARVHMLFNVFGVIWVLMVFKSFFVPFVDWMIPGNPFAPALADRQLIIADHMAAFHTSFNIINTIIFLPFIKYLAKIAEKIVPDDPESRSFHLKYISHVLVSTPAININQARLEIQRMMGIVSEMFDLITDVFKNSETKLGHKIEQIQTMENQTDLLEHDISTFLVKVSRNNLSRDQSNEISVMHLKITELESIGDQCESLMKLLRRKYDKGLTFSENGVKEILEISGKTRDFLNLIAANIDFTNKNIMTQAEVIENRIDELKKILRKQHIRRLNDEKCSVEPGLIFIDMLTCFEKIGDHAYNIAESISGQRIA